MIIKYNFNYIIEKVMTETVLIVFMAFACVMSLFAIVVVIVQMVQDSKKQRKEEQAPVVESVVEEPVKEETPVVEPVVEEPVKEENENEISFTVANSIQTLDEKYSELTPEYKSYYDEIVQYAMTKDSVKCNKTTRYEEYKIHKTRLVRLQIKRGVVICDFLLLNEDFKKFITKNKVSIKQSPVVLRVLSDEAVQAAKNSIDIAVKAAEDEKERQEKLKRTKQRETKKRK